MCLSNESDLNLWQSLVSIARFHAFRHPTISAEIDDCAISFAYKMVCYLDSRAQPRTGFSPAWVNRCAENFARNYVRSTVRLRAKEFCCSSETDTGAFAAFASPAPPLETGLLRRELRNRILTAIYRLESVQRDVFLRRHLKAETVESIALSFGATPNAIRKTLGRARRKLQDLLQEDGGTEIELRGYLAPASTSIRERSGGSPWPGDL